MAVFKPTSYKLMNVATGREFLDEGWTLAVSYTHLTLPTKA